LEVIKADCLKTAQRIAGCEFTMDNTVDSDRDGLSDLKEVNETFTNPCDPNSCGPTPDGNRDSDADGIMDREDQAPLCTVADQRCGIPLRPGTKYGTDGVVESSCKAVID